MRLGAFLLVMLVAISARADVESFAVDALIVPMDVGAADAPPADPTDAAYQNYGLLRAFGLVHAWLKEGIAVHWAIDESKATFDAVDFNIAARFDPGPSTDAGTAHDYRGGPFIVRAADAARARAILADFNSGCGETAAPFCVHVHEAAETFTTNVARKLIAAPTIGVLIDGNEEIAFRYLNAAGLLTSIETAWPADCGGGACDGIPEVMAEAAVAGCMGADDPGDPGCTPSGTGGALFDADGDPNVCQLMTMHYVSTAWEPHTQAAVSAFLTDQPTHFYTECDAAKRFEDELRLLTFDGIKGENKHNGTDEQLNNGSAFAQAATTIQGEGGSLKRWSVLGAGYRPTTEVHAIRPGFAVGLSDLWATGFAFGDASNGKVSMLGGHDYCKDNACLDAALSERKVAGVKYFLNSLFEAPCATAAGQAVLDVDKSGPALVDGDAQVTWTIDVANDGITAAKTVVVLDELPAGVVFVSASGGGGYDANEHTVRWDLGRIGAGDDEALTVTVALLSLGDYTNDVVVTHRVALTVLSVRDSFTTTAINLPPLPDTPVITTPADGTATSDDTVTVAGTAEPGASVDVYVDGTLTASATADGSGDFVLELPALADGTYALTARALDTLGRPSPFSATVEVTVDTVAPAAPVILSPADGTTTSEDTPTITGTAEPGATLTITLDDGSAVTVTADTDGGWSYTVDAGSPLSTGDHTVRVSATDAAGNAGPTAEATFTVGGGVDTTAPDTLIDSGPSSPTELADADFFFSSTEAGSTFECSLDGAAYAACSSPVTLTALAAGSHTFRVRATDDAGNTDPTPAVFVWVIDPNLNLDAGPLPDGAIVLPDGAVVFPDGGIVPDDGGKPDGGLPGDGGLPDGAVVQPDGAVILPDGGANDGGLQDDGGGRDRSLPAGVCGNGLTEQGESCDDGNDDADDGCDADCAVELGWACDDFDPSYCVEQEDWDHLVLGGGGCGCRSGTMDPSWLTLFAVLAGLRGLRRRHERRRRS